MDSVHIILLVVYGLIALMMLSVGGYLLGRELYKAYKERKKQYRRKHLKLVVSNESSFISKKR